MALLKKRKAQEQEQAKTSTEADTKTSSSSSSASSTSTSSSSSSSSAASAAAAPSTVSASASNTTTIIYDEDSFVAAVASNDLDAVKLSFDAVKDDLKICEKALKDAAFAGHLGIVECLDQKIKFDAPNLKEALRVAVWRNWTKIVEYFLNKQPQAVAPVQDALNFSITQRRPVTLDLLSQKYAQRISTSFLKSIQKDVLAASSPSIQKGIQKLLKKRKAQEQEQAKTSTEADTKTSSSSSSASSTSTSSSSSSSSATSAVVAPSTATASASNNASITYDKNSFVAAVASNDLDAVKLSFDAVKDDLKTCEKALKDAASEDNMDIVAFLDQKISFKTAELQQKSLQSAFTEAVKNNCINVVRYFLNKNDPEIDSNGVGRAFQRAAGQQRSKIVDLFLNNPMYETRIPTSSLEAVLGNAKSEKIKKKITNCLAKREAQNLAQTRTEVDAKTPSSASSTSSASSSSSSSSSNEKIFLAVARDGNYDTIKLIIDAASHELTHHTVGQALIFSIVHNHEKVSELLISHNATKATVKIAAAAYEDAFYAASIFERNKVVELFLKYHANGTIKIGSFCLLRARCIIRDQTLKQFIFSQFRFRPQTGNVASASPLELLASAAVASAALPNNSTTVTPIVTGALLAHGQAAAASVQPAATTPPNTAASASASNTANIIYDEKSFVAAVKSGDLNKVKLSFHAVKDTFEICTKALQDVAFAGHLGIVKFLDQNISFKTAELQQTSLQSAFTEAVKNNCINVVQYFLDKEDPQIDSTGVSYAFEQAIGKWRSTIVDLFLDNPEYETRILTCYLKVAQGQAKSKKMNNKIAKHFAIRNVKEQTQTSMKADAKTPSSASSTSGASSSSSSSSSHEKNFLDAAADGNYDTIKSIIDAASHELTQHTIGQALIFSIVHDHEKVSELLINHNATKATVKIAATDYEKAFCVASRLARNKVVKLFLGYHANGTIKIADFWLLKAHSITPDPALRRVIFSQIGPQTGNVASAPPATNASPLALLASAAVEHAAPPSNSTNAK